MNAPDEKEVHEAIDGATTRARKTEEHESPEDFAPLPAINRNAPERIRDYNTWERRWLVLRLLKIGCHRYSEIRRRLAEDYGIEVLEQTVSEDFRAVKKLYVDQSLESLKQIRSETIAKLKALELEALQHYNEVVSQKDKQQWWTRAAQAVKDQADYAGVKQDVRLAIQSGYDEDNKPSTRAVLIGSF